MSQIYKTQAEITFGLHPSYLQKPLQCLELYLNKKLGRHIEAYTNLKLSDQTAEVSPFSPLLIAKAKAELLIFIPSRKFLAVNNSQQNKANARGIFQIGNPTSDEIEVCSFKEFSKGKIIVDWF